MKVQTFNLFGNYIIGIPSEYYIFIHGNEIVLYFKSGVLLELSTYSGNRVS